MFIELMIVSIAAIAACSISVKLYARRQDVLYGPYIQREPTSGLVGPDP